MLELLDDFTRGRVDIKGLNYAIITLLPKTPGAKLFKPFRPTGLINVGFCLLVKGFATRLTPVIISQSHSAFIQGHNILEGISILHEVLHLVNQQNESFLILKSDFEKVYGCFNREFLKEVMGPKGFSPLWVSWIIQMVRGGQTAINVNKELGPYFRNSKGVMQGDPISPLLFNIVVETLAVILDLEGARKAGHI